MAEVIPADYDGVMSTERGRSYDAPTLDAVKQQKGLSHLQRTMREVLERQEGPARVVGERLKAVLHEARELGHAYHGGGGADFAGQATRLQKAITRHVRPRQLRNRDKRAERSLRSAVMVRKVSQCSKTEGGAEAFSAFSSVIKTCAKAGRETMVDQLYALLRGARVPRASPL